jgi:Helix-turn-helix domain
MGNADLIGSAEACEILDGIDRATLVRRIARGELKTVTKLPGLNGQWLFDRAEVLRHKAEVDAAGDGRKTRSA